MLSYWGRIIGAAAAAFALALISYALFPYGVLLPIAALLIIYRHWDDQHPEL